MTVRQRSGGRSDRSKHPPGEVTHALRENLGELREQASEQATALAQGLRARGQNLVEEQKIRAAAEISNLGAAIRRAADKLHDQKSERLASYVDTAADSLDGVAQYVQEHDLNDLVREMEQFARRRPALIVGGVFLAGLAVGRFVKAAQPAQSTSRTSHKSRRNGRRDRNGTRRPRSA